MPLPGVSWLYKREMKVDLQELEVCVCVGRGGVGAQGDESVMSLVQRLDGHYRAFRWTITVILQHTE